ncbi:MAG TPA: CHAT domain-containing protein [Thermoanaerobaculia bacterium]
MSSEIQFTGDVRKLEPGQPVEAELSAMEGHRYEIDLKADQYVHLVADQRGIDVVLRLRAPGAPEDSSLFKVDSPRGELGQEQIFLIPQVSGLFRLEVFCEQESVPAGGYKLKLTAKSPDDNERSHVQAFQLFQEGEALRRKKEDPTAGGQAVAKYEEALKVWRDLGDREWQAESLFRIAQVQQDRLRDRDAALSAAREALPLFQDIGKRDLEGVVLNQLGRLELRSGRISEAIDFHGKAAAIFRELGQPGAEAGALNGLGAAYDVAGKSQEALDAYGKGLERARAARRFREEEAAALRGIGEVLLSQGKLQEAMDHLRQSHDIYDDLKNLADTAHVLSRMAAIDQRLGRLEDALPKLEKALALKQQLVDKEGEVVTLSSLGTLHLLRNETAKAGEIYTRALTQARNTDNRFGEAFSVLNLGRQKFYAGQYRDAVRLHDEAAVLFREIGSRRGEVSTLYGAARALRALGEFAAARQRLDQVVNGVEMLRAESENLDLRSSYFATKQHYFELYIDILMSLHERDPGAGFDAEALALNDRRRARGLLETLAEAQPSLQSEADPELLAQRQELQRRINNAEAGIQFARAEGNEAEVARVEEKQRERLFQLAELEARIRGVSSEPAQPKPMKLSEIQNLVGPWGLLLVYSLGEERSRLWSLAADGQLHSYTLPPREKLEQAARKIRDEWGRPNGEREAVGSAAWLSREILGPVADELGESRLLIVADGALEALPFAALPDPRALDDETAPPLVLRNEIVHLPSVSTLAALRRVRRRAAPPSWIAVLADPVFSPRDPRVQAQTAAAGGPRSSASSNLTRAAADFEIESFDRLPFTRDEAKAIEQLVPKHTRVALDFEASRDLVESQELKRYRILHFATHGLLNSRHPELSGLVLSLVDRQGNPRDDGFLLAHEIGNLDLRAHLVVLSACQTGLGDEVRGEGLVNLTRSFMQAGVPKVVVSLWNVNDRATSELMTRFYRAMIEKGLPPSSALRCAQISMRRRPEWSSPYFWAPFIFQGDWQTRGGPGEPPIEKLAAPSQPPPTPDDDYPPPGSGGIPTCPDLD